MVFWMIYLQTRMMSERGRASYDFQRLSNDLWDRTKVASQKAHMHDKRLGAVQETLTQLVSTLHLRLQEVAEEQGRVRQSLAHLSELIKVRGERAAEAEQRVAEISDRLAVLVGGVRSSGGTAKGPAAPSLREVPPAPPERQPPDEGTAAEVERLMRKYQCPQGYPHPYKADDLLIPNHCCSAPVNCRGRPISSTREFECCGGEDASMPITYRYEPPNGSPVACGSFPWWSILAGASGPLWPAMKRFTESRRGQDEASADAESALGRPVWAGGNDSSLSAADVQKARQYVGSAWGRSGQRQFETARKFMDTQPEHHFLEIGCGALNGGQFFISYLNTSRYVCVEPNTVLYNLSVSASATLQANVSEKLPRLVARDDFDPRPGIEAGRLFDRSWSHSVLSHAADWQLMQYFEVMAAVLRPSTGVGMASIRFSEGTGTAENPTHDVSWVYPGVSYFDFAEARCMAQRVGLELSLVPEARLFMTEVVPVEFHDWVRMRRP